MYSIITHLKLQNGQLVFWIHSKLPRHVCHPDPSCLSQKAQEPLSDVTDLIVPMQETDVGLDGLMHGLRRSVPISSLVIRYESIVVQCSYLS